MDDDQTQRRVSPGPPASPSASPGPPELVATVGVPLLTLAVLIGVRHTQDHDDLAMQLKMDEIIRVLEGTRERMMNVEEEDRAELRLQIRYRRKDSA